MNTEEFKSNGKLTQGFPRTQGLAAENMWLDLVPFHSIPVLSDTVAWPGNST